MHARRWLLGGGLALVACHHGGSPRLEGRWHGVTADGVSADQQATADAFAGGFELEFRGDVIAMSMPKSDRQVGRFKVKKDDKGPPAVVVIATEKDGPEDEDTFTFVDDKTMKWSVLPGKTITLKRQGSDGG